MENLAFDLGRLIYPIDPETFKREYWEKKPLVITRQDQHYYRSLLSLADVDRILSTSSIRPPDFRVLREGKEIPLNDLVGPGRRHETEALYEKYRDGCTIVIQFLHQRFAPLMRLCQSLAAEFSASFQVNVYLTPANEKGLNTHYDTHDVFVLQAEGVKHWRLFQESIHLPLMGQPHRQQGMSSENLLAEFDLHPGDAIYIPRGYDHDAVAVDSTSLHLTVGVQPITWAFVLLDAMETIIEQDPRFRESLPLGFASDKRKQEMAEGHLLKLLDILRQQIKPTSIISNAVEVALQGRQPFLEGHLLDLEARSQVSLETRVRRRPEILWRLSVEDEKTCLYFHGKIVRMPSFVQSDLQFITEVDEFKALDLPGDLDEVGRLMLIRRLLAEGFLTVCR